MSAEMHAGRHVKCPLFLSNFYLTLNYADKVWWKSSTLNFTKIGSEVVTCGQTYTARQLAQNFGSDACEGKALAALSQGAANTCVRSLFALRINMYWITVYTNRPQMSLLRVGHNFEKVPFECPWYFDIVTCSMCDYRMGLDWWIDWPLTRRNYK
jgi:hypothetical protein